MSNKIIIYKDSGRQKSILTSKIYLFLLKSYSMRNHISIFIILWKHFSSIDQIKCLMSHVHITQKPTLNYISIL